MVQFPETAAVEWKTVADQTKVKDELRRRIERGTKVEKEVDALHVRHAAKLQFEQELDADLTPPVVIQTMEDYLKQNTPVLVDMIDGVLKENSVCLMLGPAESGKSTLMVQMMHSLLTGADWLGQPTKPLMGSVGLLSYDQDIAIPINWMSKMGVPHDRISPIDLNGKGHPLNVPSERSRIAAAWKMMNVEVVFIDSFSASFSAAAAGDQNDTGDVMNWYSSVKKFVFNEVGAKAVVVIVHSTDANPLKPRGSTAHRDVADSIISVTRGEDNKRKVRMTKYRAGLNQVEMAPVIVTDPDAVTHLVKIDSGAMSMEGMRLPASVAAEAFEEMPEPINEPVYEQAEVDDIAVEFFDEEEGDDL